MADLLTVEPPEAALVAAPSSFAGSVAIVHDFLNQAGGAERVVLTLTRMFPQAPVYTSLYRPGSTFAEFSRLDVRTSPLQRLPVDEGFRNLFPLYPAAFRSFGVLEEDLVISSSSGWAHAIRTRPTSFHVVYCHAPARWLYGQDHTRGVRNLALRPFLGAMRRWDRNTARLADLYIANGMEVRSRIRRRYGLRAPVVHPPVDVERFTPTPRGERLLVVSRLLPYKRIDVIVEAAGRAGIGLDVVGVGPQLADLRHRAGPTVTFHGNLTDDEVTELMQGCRAFCVPGREDFGIAAVEAQAAGKPVVAFAAGGALETVQAGVTGSFFTRHELNDVLAAIRRCDRLDTPPAVIAGSAARFAPAMFEARLMSTIHHHLAAKQTQLMGAAEHLGPVAPRLPATVTPGSAEQRVPVSKAHELVGLPRPLMLGKAWFGDQELGGLDRYYRDLFERMPESLGIVIGSRAQAPAGIIGVSDHDRPLPHRLLAFWRATQRVAQDVDVVDAHLALYALAPLRFGRLRRKPAVVHFHGPWAQENVSAGDRSRVRLLIRRALERAAYRRANETIVLTSAFRRTLIERYRCPPWTINVVPPGVDLQRFSPGSTADARAALGLDSDAFVAVAVRRLVPRMGLDVLIEAWAEVLPALPSGSALIVVGDGAARTQLESQVSRLGLEGSVRLLGLVGDEQLVQAYRAADIAVVPSRQHEGFGLVVIEAAACGTPSIVTDVDGLPEAIAGLDSSLIVPAENRAALRDRLLDAVHDRPSPALTRAYAERFNWENAIERNRQITRRAADRAPRDDRLKVVYLDHVARLSGGELALLRLLPHLERTNPHVILAEDGPLVRYLDLAGISSEVLPLGNTARDMRKGNVHRQGLTPEVALTSAAYVVRLAARLRALRPDLVHTNSLKAGVYGSLAARLAGVPVVWHVRDRIAEDYLPAPAVAMIRAMTRHLATAVVANSQSTMETIAIEQQPVVIYSVLPEVLNEAPVRRRSSDRPLTFGVVGRLAPWKGQDFFLRAFARTFPDGDERAVLVGGALFGEDDYAYGLARLIKQLGIEDRVEQRGHRTDVWDELARLDVLVHASVTPEPFGQVILEGMAAGVPVIAAGAGGPTEMIVDGQTGLLYEPANIDGLAEAMSRMRDPELRSRLSAAAHEGLGRYSPSVVAGELQDLYATVTAQTRRRT